MGQQRRLADTNARDATVFSDPQPSPDAQGKGARDPGRWVR